MAKMGPTKRRESHPAELRRIDKLELLRAFSNLVSTDRSNTAALVAYIGEIDRRKLYLEDAYPSMFALCTKHFGMSESIASKRIRAGRAACRFPRILDMLRTGELHLSGVHQLAGYLTEKNHKRVLRRAKHRSMREIDELIAEIAPTPDPGSLMRALPEEEAATPRNGQSARPPADGASARARKDEPKESDSVPGSTLLPGSNLKSLTVPMSPRRFRLHVTISQEARDMLDELRNLLSHQIPDGDPAPIVERALESLLKETKKKRAALTDKPRVKQTSRKRKRKLKRTRTIPAEVRRKVFARDDGRCAFVDAEGRRCDSQWQLEFHHCVPYGRAGPNSVENIELRCRAHNQYEAELEYGRAFMAKRRQSA